MYEPRPPRGPHVIEDWYYLYPPFLASALSLAPSLPFETFARVWLLFLLAAFWVYAACLARLATGSVTVHRTLVAGAALGLTPGLVHALNMGQADVLVWAMVGLALAWPALRGAGFAAAALTKINPVWPLAVAVWREGRRVVASALAAVALAVIVALAALGPHGFLRANDEWFRYVVPALSQGQFDPGDPSLELRLPFNLGGAQLPNVNPTNLSLAFAPIELARRARWWTWAGGELPAAWRVYLALIGILAPMTAAWFFRRLPHTLHYALVLCAAALFAPIFRLTNVPLLLAPAAIFWGLRRQRSGEPRSAR